MKKYFWYLVFGFLLIGLLAYSHVHRLQNGKMIVYFLDVGQGDSILIKTPSNKFILVDGGPKTKILTELNEVMPFLRKRIDLVVLTHPHADHVEGLVPVLQRYDVENALITGVAYENAYYDEFLRGLDSESNVYFADKSTDFDFGDGVIFDVIYPFESILGEEYDNINNSSIVMRVTYGENSLLLTGDAESEIEEMILENGSYIDSDVLKVGHHGSKSSTSDEFLDYVTPSVAIIQVGIENTFGHPHDETLDKFNNIGAEMYRTDIDGRIKLLFDGD